MKARTFGLTLLISTLLWATQNIHAEEAEYSSGGTKECLSCHDYSDNSPVQLLSETPHGDMANFDNPLASRGCESCHGPSKKHAQTPTQVPPGISYGPRWSSAIEKQDEPCASCHANDAARHWSGSLHQKENLSCVSCHQSHVAKDTVLTATSQIEVCTICHKPQKNGMHAIKNEIGQNPPCSNCHNPHASPAANLTMVHNRSVGCVHCHNLVAMGKAPGANPKASSYHKVMTQPGRICTDCHQGIAHVSAAGVAPVITQAVRKGNITLFSPGQSDAEWIVSQHPGAQSLRQGRDCEQCHLGEERQMGASLSKKGSVTSRDIAIAFSRNADQLVVKLSWKGAADGRQIAMMWGNDGNEAFKRGGCWASCHDDMPGMTMNRGDGQGKYLWAARAQQQLIGQPPRLKTTAELNELRSIGNYVEVWSSVMEAEDNTKTRGGTILDTLRWSDNSELTSTAKFDKGQWRVTFRRPLKGGPGGAKSFLPGKQYTFGIALMAGENTGGKHWVSLPRTFSLDDTQTDFIIRQ